MFCTVHPWLHDSQTSREPYSEVCGRHQHHRLHYIQPWEFISGGNQQSCRMVHREQSAQSVNAWCCKMINKLPLYLVRKISWFGFKQHGWKLSRGLVGNIHWFHSHSYWNSVLNWGHWLGSSLHLWLCQHSLHLPEWRSGHQTCNVIKFCGNIIMVQYDYVSGWMLETCYNHLWMENEWISTVLMGFRQLIMTFL